MKHAVTFAFGVLVALLFFPLIAYASGGPGDTAGPMQALQLGGTGLVGVYSWVASSQRAQRTDLEDAKKALAERCGTLEREVTELKEHDRHAPTAGQMTEVIGGMRELRALVLGIQESQKVQSMRFDRYEEHVLERAL